MCARLMLCAMALFMACRVSAVQLTPQEALARMNSTKTHAKGVVSENSSLQLVYTSTFNGNNSYYVFNKGNEEGFVILSADDCMPAVLGVVEGSGFDYDKIPENMKWWLSQYDYSVYSYASKGKKYASAEAKKDIAPLLGGIKWKQESPYNEMCPILDGKKSVTGCVATAMAQVMYMYQWPEKGCGKREYAFMYNDDNIRLSRDFSQSTYQWDKMLKTYDGNATKEQKDAVAQLMYDCGVAVNMRYAPDESYTYSHHTVHALVAHFNYDKNIRVEFRKYFSNEEWEDMVYDNLSKGMPVLYFGQREKLSGHAFVCDGYQADGNRFHFNWGWGGYCDGYFLLTGNDSGQALLPTDEFEEGFNLSQEAIFNLKPASEPYVDGSEGEFELVVSRSYELYCWYNDGSVQPPHRTETWVRCQAATVGGDSFHLQYPGYVEHDYAVGYKFKNEKDEYIQPIYEYKNCYPFDDLNILVGANCDVLRNGKYAVSFVYKDITAGNTEWKDAKYMPGIEKPVVEIVGHEPSFCLMEKPELQYDGKVITNDTIELVPDVMNVTIKLKVKPLKPLMDNQIDMQISNFGSNLMTCFSIERQANLQNTTSDDIQTVTFDIPVRELKPEKTNQREWYQMRLMQLFGAAETVDDVLCIPYSKYNDYTFSVIGFPSGSETEPTGIETIPQAEEKAAAIYDIYGQKIKSMHRGLNIIRMSDSLTQKILVK